MITKIMKSFVVFLIRMITKSFVVFLVFVALVAERHSLSGVLIVIVVPQRALPQDGPTAY
jgi:hypothetical protein